MILQNKIELMSIGFRKQTLIYNFERIFGYKHGWTDDINDLFEYEWNREQQLRRILK